MAASVDLDDLPPMHAPDSRRMRAEASVGLKAVLFVIAVLLALTHGIALNPSSKVSGLPEGARIACLVLIHLEAVMALICLERILRADPGVIRRGPETCRPVPHAVAERISSNRGLRELRNVDDPKRGVYCVRCLVWRPRDRKAHHCSTCQRCVLDFDHHCGFFGRCIAGTATSGNLPWFFLIITFGYLGALTCLIFCLAAIILATQ
ncbi:DHHC palmitoyltransferase-domain-containing protein [Pelagophyceae sp. CCMP2097]|nr:DHHC palmitoyltransferase-domain-containing protein [Pelagophyceae sp. CCMP2097]